MIERGTPTAQLLFLLLLVVLARDLFPFLRVTSYIGSRSDPDSQHPDGTAMDFGVRQGQERAAAEELQRRWSALGLTAVLELNAPGGPHLHIQLFRRGQSVLTFG